MGTPRVRPLVLITLAQLYDGTVEYRTFVQVIAYVPFSDAKLSCLGLKKGRTLSSHQRTFAWKSPRRSGSQLALGGRVKSDRKRLANFRSPSTCNRSSAAPP